ncbi:hypothetical protein [Botrimarina colliarenosi]|uniref:hypothetical protein n=1 Tax=Botrimarina colliarenosi TaxID=2528001 RepID=UPI0011B6DB6C|nr:hypothetical protein [Botrimarina colliarenosi]
MPHRVTLRTLRSACCVLRRSFLAYLSHARPYVGPEAAAEEEVLDELIARQEALADRVAAKVQALGGEEPHCDFPAEFTAAHDVSIGYAMRRAAELHQADLVRLRELREEQHDPDADKLLADVVHEAEAIRDQFKLANQPAGAR